MLLELEELLGESCHQFRRKRISKVTRKMSRKLRRTRVQLRLNLRGFARISSIYWMKLWFQIHRVRKLKSFSAKWRLISYDILLNSQLQIKKLRSLTKLSEPTKRHKELLSSHSAIHIPWNLAWHLIIPSSNMKSSKIQRRPALWPGPPSMRLLQI